LDDEIIQFVGRRSPDVTTKEASATAHEFAL
jgi:hypothetical protein